MSEDNYSEKRLINSPFYKDANELRFEISVLNRQLEVAREALRCIEYGHDDRDGTIIIAEPEGSLARYALAEIERIGKESGINLTIGEEDGKV
jgi:hypothetical protein